MFDWPVCVVVSAVNCEAEGSILTQGKMFVEEQKYLFHVLMFIVCIGMHLMYVSLNSVVWLPLEHAVPSLGSGSHV